MFEAVHVGVSDNQFTQLDEAKQTGMTRCQVIKPPVQVDVKIDVGCANGTYGQYIYISLIRTNSEAGYFQLYEVDVYIGEYVK